MLKSPAGPAGLVRGAALEARTEALRVPTGVSDFDHITGGVPAGSVLLLAGENGAGAAEFALTSAVTLLRASREAAPGPRALYLGSYRGPVRVPARVTYVSLTRSREQVLAEAESTFPPEYSAILADGLEFVDLSSSYFADTVVPNDWTERSGSLLDPAPSGAEPTPLHALAREMDRRGPGSLLVVDSLTDLLVRSSTNPEELLTLVKGLRRRAKEWNGLVYLMLTRHVSDPALEQGLMDSVDGVLGFSWVQNPLKSVRARALLVEKSMSLLSRVPKELHGRFLLDVKGLQGLVTTQYERI